MNDGSPVGDFSFSRLMTPFFHSSALRRDSAKTATTPPCDDEDQNGRSNENQCPRYVNIPPTRTSTATMPPAHARIVTPAATSGRNCSRPRICRCASVEIVANLRTRGGAASTWSRLNLTDALACHTVYLAGSCRELPPSPRPKRIDNAGFALRQRVQDVVELFLQMGEGHGVRGTMASESSRGHRTRSRHPRREARSEQNRS